MKKFIFILLMAIMSCSDTEEVKTEEGLTFEEVAVLFDMKEPFSESSKNFILDKYGSVDEYYNYSISRLEEIETNKNIGVAYSRGADYTITLFNEDEDLLVDIQCYSDEIILDTAENNGIELPYSDRAGASTTCAGRQHIGIAVDQSEQTALTSYWEESGYVILCVAYPRSDSTIETHVEDELY